MRVALVAPSAAVCAAVAESMAARAAVEVLATCAGEHEPWRDVRDPGCTNVAGVTRRLFRSDAPVVPALEARLAVAARRGSAASALQERWLQERGPYSSALLDHLERHGGEHDVVVFFVLEAATTVFGLPLAGAPAVLVPRVSDWTSLSCEIFARTVERAAGLVFASEEERRRIVEAFGEQRPAAVADGASPEPYLEVAAKVSAAEAGRHGIR